MVSNYLNFDFQDAKDSIGGVISSALRTLDRPRGAAIAALKLQNPLEGFKNPDQYQGRDVLGIQNIQNKRLRNIAGTAVDIAADPLNLLAAAPVKALSKVGVLSKLVLPVNEEAGALSRVAANYAMGAGARAGSELATAGLNATPLPDYIKTPLVVGAGLAGAVVASKPFNVNVAGRTARMVESQLNDTGNSYFDYIDAITANDGYHIKDKQGKTLYIGSTAKEAQKWAQENIPGEVNGWMAVKILPGLNPVQIDNIIYTSYNEAKAAALMTSPLFGESINIGSKQGIDYTLVPVHGLIELITANTFRTVDIPIGEEGKIIERNVFVLPVDRAPIDNILDEQHLINTRGFGENQFTQPRAYAAKSNWIQNTGDPDNFESAGYILRQALTSNDEKAFDEIVMPLYSEGEITARQPLSKLDSPFSHGNKTFLYRGENNLIISVIDKYGNEFGKVKNYEEGQILKHKLEKENNAVGQYFTKIDYSPLNEKDFVAMSYTSDPNMAQEFTNGTQVYNPDTGQMEQVHFIHGRWIDNDSILGAFGRGSSEHEYIVLNKIQISDARWKKMTGVDKNAPLGTKIYQVFNPVDGVTVKYVDNERAATDFIIKESNRSGKELEYQQVFRGFDPQVNITKSEKMAKSDKVMTNVRGEDLFNVYKKDGTIVMHLQTEEIAFKYAKANDYTYEYASQPTNKFIGMFGPGQRIGITGNDLPSSSNKLPDEFLDKPMIPVSKNSLPNNDIVNDVVKGIEGDVITEEVLAKGLILAKQRSNKIGKNVFKPLTIKKNTTLYHVTSSDYVSGEPIYSADSLKLNKGVSVSNKFNPPTGPGHNDNASVSLHDNYEEAFAWNHEWLKGKGKILKIKLPEGTTLQRNFEGYATVPDQILPSQISGAGDNLPPIKPPTDSRPAPINPDDANKPIVKAIGYDSGGRAHILNDDGSLGRFAKKGELGGGDIIPVEGTHQGVKPLSGNALDTSRIILNNEQELQAAIDEGRAVKIGDVVFASGGKLPTPAQLGTALNYDYSIIAGPETLDAFNKSRAEVATLKLMGGRIVPQTVQDELVNLFLSHLDDKARVDPTILSRANSVFRGLWATADASWMGIQGLMTIPRMIATGNLADAGGTFYASMATLVGSKKAFGEFLIHQLETLPVDAPPLNVLIHNGLKVNFLERVGDFDMRLLDRVTGGHLQPDAAFNVYGDAMRISTFYNEWARYGKPTGEELKGLINAVNRSTGVAEHAFGGQIGTFAMFAPRFFQSQLESVAHALTDGSIEGSLARRQFLTMIGTGASLTIASNYLRGYTDTDQFNPTSPNFMRIRNIGGQDISVFGPWDSLVKLVMHLGTGDFAYAQTKASPLVTIGINTLRGTTYLGEDFNNPAVVAKSLLLPFGFQNFGRETWTGFGIGLLGVKSSPQSAKEVREANMANLGLDPTDPLAIHEYLAENPEQKPLFTKAQKDVNEVQQDIRSRVELNNEKTTTNTQTLVQFRNNRTILQREQRNKLEVLLKDSNFKADTTKRQWIQSYYSLFDAAKDPITHDVNPSQLDELQSNWISTNGQQAYDYLQSYLLVNKTPTDLVYLNDMKKLKDLNYFNTPKYKSNVYSSGLDDHQIQSYRDMVSAARSANSVLASLPYNVAARLVLGKVINGNQINSITMAGLDIYSNPQIEIIKKNNPELFIWFNPNATWSTRETLLATKNKRSVGIPTVAQVQVAATSTR